ncbi:SDR family NAD(P)-dependent oxidoreductase [Actinopolyspora mortivallis]|uniref:Short-chain dehydrogenase n=1 Tax=Actinopolyspora mortivallis TaxID=33906 RepID=A0A2T0GUF5_ACTMO|nr:SDR family NAD(P)-dependent oxidoreductase [Actinopolyspora mortivallis]PRW62727.1 short-chain dehydrogenase [Actinopolyspora mortivallis]
MTTVLRGRKVLVTGGSSGIGAATTLALARRGCEVVVTGRDERALRAVAARTGARPLAADLGSPEGLARLVEEAGPPDVLINNAGLGWSGETETMPGTEVRRLLAVNLAAPVELTRMLLPAMRSRGGGHIVFVSSIATVGVGTEAVYSATKAGLRAFAAALRDELAGKHVAVTTVFPGAVRTPFFRRRGQEYTRSFPRMLPPEEVAERMLRAVERGEQECFLPRWLGLACRANGLLPGTFHRLSRWFGPTA